MAGNSRKARDMKSGVRGLAARAADVSVRDFLIALPLRKVLCVKILWRLSEQSDHLLKAFRDFLTTRLPVTERVESHCATPLNNDNLLRDGPGQCPDGPAGRDRY
jgi:hypothetical protein